MKARVTFKEETTKTIEIEGKDMDEIWSKAESYSTENIDKIDFGKNPDDYTVNITSVEEL